MTMAKMGGNMKKIIVFGTGLYWENRKKYIIDVVNIICFLDNNRDKWNTEFCGTKIDKPDNIRSYQYDYILIMCKAEEAVRLQLEKLDVPKEKIISYSDYRKLYLGDWYIQYCEKNEDQYDIIVISTDLNYNGGTIAAIYVVQALIGKGKRSLLCAENCDDKLLKELRAQNIDVMLAPGLPYSVNSTLRKYIDGCEIVLVNVFQMLPVVSQLNGKKPLLWWIHEPEELYTDILRRFAEFVDGRYVSKVNIVAVSKIAADNFNNRFPQKINKTMPYGIPDRQICNNYCKDRNKRITFAVIGSVIERKAQDVYIEAIKHFTKAEMDEASFYIIGQCCNDDYSHNIMQQADKNNIIMTGNLTRSEMEKIYNEIDVVVCPSREETMSIVLTEAMMYGKPCISSDKTGMADYIKEGVNGFVVKTEDVCDLYDKMRYFISNPDEIDRMGNEGRRVYEEYFTMERFSDRLCDRINETIDMFYGDQINDK